MTLTIGNDATPVVACPLCRRADMTSRDDPPKGIGGDGDAAQPTMNCRSAGSSASPHAAMRSEIA